MPESSKTSDVLPNKFCVYVLLSLKDQNFYVGFTRDLKRSLSEHSRGLSISTRLRRPFQLIHYEYYINEQDAKAREVFLKSGFGRSQLKLSLKKTLGLK